MPPVCVSLPVPPHRVALVQPGTSSCHGGSQDRSPPTGGTDVARPTRWEQQQQSARWRRSSSTASTGVCGTECAASVHHVPRFKCACLLLLLDA